MPDATSYCPARMDHGTFARAKAGDPAAIESIVSDLWPRAWRLAFSVLADRGLAEDVAQDAFERAFRGLGAFAHVGALRRWLDQVVVRRAIDVSRRERRRGEREHRGGLRIFEGAGHDDDPVDHGLRRRCAALPAPMRVVVALHYWFDLGLDDIAEALEIPKGTVRSRLSRALEQLRAEVAAPGE
jgi:RNA polymerase sigma-70 factor, ECF subfamily